ARGQEGAPTDQGLRRLRPTVRVAEAMGPRLGRGPLLQRPLPGRPARRRRRPGGHCGRCPV
ncbi:MAG: hypothetical protein AVDCRST_MAG49-3782, partial [uncultured Thermomicrobiales bacterium]